MTFSARPTRWVQRYESRFALGAVPDDTVTDRLAIQAEAVSYGLDAVVNRPQDDLQPLFHG
jgi:hypothetical protein